MGALKAREWKNPGVDLAAGCPVCRADITMAMAVVVQRINIVSILSRPIVDSQEVHRKTLLISFIDTSLMIATTTALV